MQEYLTKKNIGWAISALLGLALIASAAGKFTGGATEQMATHNIGDWTLIIGIGELLSLILFLVPKTMRLGALLLSAYFGGAIMFHMAHPDPALSDFTAPAAFLVTIWVAAWLRGMMIIEE